ncbi:hypothetical protein [Streptosporangium brasiliense]|uniref:Uncharacterized protein n=1 Tax=Streptosporangium brasiliense TaxID=47480 RepID=A0ABT9QWY9_9ACTN|nr:hypothetical protein [Streptosporangium brasiliense]MDP9860765.1 hypothetical protein [Streptosporangium brasiliense]
MGKFDGMDPELVRDLLSEVKQAVTRMRDAEGRITQLMSGAGLSSQSAHRPSQVADACEVMVRDVSARVALLEKKIKQEAAPAAEPRAGEPKTADPGSEADGKSEPRPTTPKAEDLKPAVPRGDEGPPAREHPQADRPKDGSEPDPRPDPKPDTGSKGDESSPRDTGSKGDETPSRETGSRGDETPSRDTGSDSKGGTGSKGDETSPRDGGPTSDRSGDDDGSRKVNVYDPRMENVSDNGSDLKPDTGSKGDETSPRDGGSVPDGSGEGFDPPVENVSDDGPGVGSEDGAGSDFKDGTGSKGDETSPRDGGSVPDGSGEGFDPPVENVSDDGPGVGSEDGAGSDFKDGTGSKGDETSPRDGGSASDGDILDTARKDHPDDIDQRGDMKPRVVAVDGVPVLQVPLDSPTAAEVAELLKNIEDIPPLEMPGADGGSDTAARPDRIEPRTAPPWTDSGVPVPDTADLDQAFQPPDGQESGTRSAGNAPGSAETRPAVGQAAAWQADGDVVSVQADPPSVEALKTLADNARDVEPVDMPSVRVPDGETWGEGAWAPMDVGPDGPAGDVDPGDPLRPVPPPGGRSGGQ